MHTPNQYKRLRCVELHRHSPTCLSGAETDRNLSTLRKELTSVALVGLVCRRHWRGVRTVELKHWSVLRAVIRTKTRLSKSFAMKDVKKRKTKIHVRKVHECSKNDILRQKVSPLTPNDRYSGRTAPLTSKRCILYIYSTNTGTEYFKHGINSPFFLFKMQFVS